MPSPGLATDDNGGLPRMQLNGPEALCRRSGYFLAGLGLLFSVAHGDPDWKTDSNEPALAREVSESQVGEWIMHYIHQGTHM